MISSISRKGAAQTAAGFSGLRCSVVLSGAHPGQLGALLGTVVANRPAQPEDLTVCAGTRGVIKATRPGQGEPAVPGPRFPLCLPMY